MYWEILYWTTLDSTYQNLPFQPWVKYSYALTFRVRLLYKKKGQLRNRASCKSSTGTCQRCSTARQTGRRIIFDRNLARCSQPAPGLIKSCLCVFTVSDCNYTGSAFGSNNSINSKIWEDGSLEDLDYSLTLQLLWYTYRVAAYKLQWDNLSTWKYPPKQLAPSWSYV